MSREATNAEDGDRGAVVTGGEGASQAPLHRRAQLREPAPARPSPTGASSREEAWDDSNKKDK